MNNTQQITDFLKPHNAHQAFFRQVMLDLLDEDYMSEDIDLHQHMEYQLRQALEPLDAWATKFLQDIQPLLQALDAWRPYLPRDKPFSTPVTRHCASNRRRMLAYRRSVSNYE